MDLPTTMKWLAWSLLKTPDDDHRPESLYYLDMDSNIDDWNTVRSMLLRLEFIVIKFDAVSLTDKGREAKLRVIAAIDRTDESRPEPGTAT